MRMPQAIPAIALVILSLMLGGQPAQARGDQHQEKEGILLVAFGSTYPQAQAAFENIESKVKKTFPDVPVRWAYTSHIIRHVLAGRGRNVDSPAQALAKMMDAGFTRVAVQSLHTIGGAEFHDLKSVVNGFRTMHQGFDQISLGVPLLSSHQDLVRVRKALLSDIPAKRRPEDAVILMGHGTHHPANAFYEAMAYEFQQADPNVYVGTVEGWPSLDTILAKLKAKGTTKAYLMPFMSVAGDHVHNDMAGDGQESWTSILSRSGIACQPVFKGTAEFDNVADIWVDHLQAAMAVLQ